MSNKLLVIIFATFVVLVAFAVPHIKFEPNTASADEGFNKRYPGFVKVAEEAPGYAGDAPIYKFKDGNTTCYIMNGDHKAAMGCVKE